MTSEPNGRLRATLIGFSAVALWSLLALFTVGSAPVPPLLLNALCGAIGGTIGGIWVLRTGENGAQRAVSWKVYAFGTAGLSAIICCISRPCGWPLRPKPD